MTHRTHLHYIALLTVTSACSQAATPQALPAEAPAALSPAAEMPQTAAGTAAVPVVSTEPKPEEFSLAPIQPGYQRFEAAPVDVPVGTSDDWAQWVSGPLEQDYDVLDITGNQSTGGHHALLYATVEAQPTGFTRLWKDEDQTTTRIMGGIGGEGGATAKLPAGVVFRVKKGSYLLLQTHYLNTQDKPLVGRAYVDVKFGPVDPNHRVASIFANTTNAVMLPARTLSALDVTCDVKADLKFLQVSNHMHYYGLSTFTEFTGPDGVTHMLKQDSTWAEDLALNPNLTHYPADAPQLVPAGSQMRTHCEWNNTSDSPVTFPSEMCVFFGFIYAEADVTCNSNKWTTAAPSRAASAMPSPSVPTAGASAPGPAVPTAGVPSSAGASASPGADCASVADRSILDAPEFDAAAVDCSTACAFDPELAACVLPCFEGLGLSPTCAACNSATAACSAKHCRSNCLVGTDTPECRGCVMSMCGTELSRCEG